MSNPFDSLPDGVLCHILGGVFTSTLLDVCSLVCKRWYRLRHHVSRLAISTASDNTVRRFVEVSQVPLVDIRLFHTCIDATTVELLPASLRFLHCGYYNIFDLPVFPFATRPFQCLEVLSLQMWMIRELPSSTFPCLQIICFKEVTLDDKLLQAIVGLSPKLQTLGLFICDGVRNPTIVSESLEAIDLQLKAQEPLGNVKMVTPRLRRLTIGHVGRLEVQQGGLSLEKLVLLTPTKFVFHGLTSIRSLVLESLTQENRLEDNDLDLWTPENVLETLDRFSRLQFIQELQLNLWTEYEPTEGIELRPLLAKLGNVENLVLREGFVLCLAMSQRVSPRSVTELRNLRTIKVVAATTLHGFRGLRALARSCRCLRSMRLLLPAAQLEDMRVNGLAHRLTQLQECIGSAERSCQEVTPCDYRFKSVVDWAAVYNSMPRG